MKTFLAWLPALLLYLGFLGWYQNWGGPLTPAEVEGAMQRLEESGVGDADRNDRAVLRRFLEEDDGREFFMVNLVRLAPGEVDDPSGGRGAAADVLQGYTGVFLPALFERAGHPATVAGKFGGYVEAWGVEPDPGWTMMGLIRYRSRRDMVELVLDPRFEGAHGYKIAAIAETFAFPSQIQMSASPGPRVWVGLALALLAAASQIVWLLRLKK